MNFLQELETVLKSDERFVSQDGQLLKPRVQESVNQLDARLIRQLMASPVLKRHFFKDIDGVIIFDHEKFMWVVNSKEFLPDSHTSWSGPLFRTILFECLWLLLFGRVLGWALVA